MASFAETVAKIQRQNGHLASSPVAPQRLPGFLRTGIQISVLPFLVLDQAIQRAMKRVVLRDFRREGSCQKSGACCKTIVVHLSPLEVKVPFLRRLTLWWTTEVNGFVPRSFDVDTGEGETRVFSCRHLKTDGSCDRYWARPGVCRSWPRQDWFLEPRVMKGCGFRFVSKDSGTQLKVLDE
ncbi:MAG: hypothetical protein GY822_21630 [Deltaproteobacteria bacterium]|nr:hypothetical protein [Deltaproteobacteria bacterium]